MKTKLNILCALLFIAIAGSIVTTVYEGSHDFFWGWQRADKEQASMSASEAGVADEARSMYLTLRPETIGLYTDSVYNAKSGEWLPLQYRDVVVEANRPIESWWKSAISIISAMVLAFSALFQLLFFCLLVYDINKSIIFEWSNVSKLRFIGSAMLVSFVMHTLYTYLEYSTSVLVLDLPGYIISSTEIWNFHLLIPGLGILLMGEVFAMGLKLREEQELTI